MEQKHVLGGTIGYRDSYLDLLFRHFKVLILHLILHVAAEAVRAHSANGPGYCYIVGRGPTSCSLGHVTAVLFCLYVKPFLTFIFKSVTFWSSLSCSVIDMERAVQAFLRCWEFLWCEKSGILISSSKTVPTHKTSILVFKKFAQIFVEEWLFGAQRASKHSY